VSVTSEPRILSEVNTKGRPIRLSNKNGRSDCPIRKSNITVQIGNRHEATGNSESQGERRELNRIRRKKSDRESEKCRDVLVNPDRVWIRPPLGEIARFENSQNVKMSGGDPAARRIWSTRLFSWKPFSQRVSFERQFDALV
jgi:hypothetical protein